MKRKMFTAFVGMKQMNAVFPCIEKARKWKGEHFRAALYIRHRSTKKYERVSESYDLLIETKSAE